MDTVQIFLRTKQGLNNNNGPVRLGGIGWAVAASHATSSSQQLAAAPASTENEGL